MILRRKDQQISFLHVCAPSPVSVCSWPVSCSVWPASRLQLALQSTADCKPGADHHASTFFPCWWSALNFAPGGVRVQPCPVKLFVCVCVCSLPESSSSCSRSLSLPHRPTCFCLSSGLPQDVYFIAALNSFVHVCM